MNSFGEISIFFPNKSLTETPNTSANCISNSASGTEMPFSYFDMVCLTTFQRVANCSCENPFSFLSVFKFSLNICVPLCLKLGKL